MEGRVRWWVCEGGERREGEGKRRRGGEGRVR